MFSLGLVPINDIVSHECFKRLGDKSKQKKFWFKSFCGFTAIQSKESMCYVIVLILLKTYLFCFFVIYLSSKP